MDFTLTFISFLAGILTVLAPCTFPLLPVILGSSASSKNRWHPYIVIAGLIGSLFLFTAILKFTSLLIDIDPNFWRFISFGILIMVGLAILFPEYWDKISIKLGLSKESDVLLDKALEKKGFWGSLLTGAALGPVFSSCSPTYVIALSTVLQGNLAVGLSNMIAYLLGLALVMLGLALLGQRLSKRLRFMADPKGWFKRGVGVLFILLAIALLSGFDKKLELWLADINPLNPAKIEQNLLKSNREKVAGQVLNVNPPTVAPEIVDSKEWINSDPLKISELKGQVVLVDFWTYSCINCIRTQPYLNKWHDTYKDQGLVIIGVHAPEFAFEKNRENVQKAVGEAEIKYPVVLDNDFLTWKAYENQFWPAKYLIDAEGKIRYQHFGEGDYAETENAIQLLIEESGKVVKQDLVTESGTAKIRDGLTPETYLGWSREVNLVLDKKINFNNPEIYTFPQSLGKDEWSLDGNWQINNEFIMSKSKAKLRLNFSAKEVYLVMGSANKSEVKVFLNGSLIEANQAGPDVQNSEVIVQEDRLYRLVKLDEFRQDQILELEFESEIRSNAFTFEG